MLITSSSKSSFLFKELSSNVATLSLHEILLVVLSWLDWFTTARIFHYKIVEFTVTIVTLDHVIFYRISDVVLQSQFTEISKLLMDKLTCHAKSSSTALLKSVSAWIT